MIIDLFKAFLSLIKLNLIILFNKILYPKKKIIFVNQSHICQLFKSLIKFPGEVSEMIFLLNKSNYI